MGIKVLSTADVPVKFGSVDYSDPLIVQALCGAGLKERTTVRGQIVTALKMVWWICCLPVVMPFKGVIKCCNWVRWVCTACYRSSCVVVSSATRNSAVLLELTNMRFRVMGLIGLIWLVISLGLLGILVWGLIVITLFLCFVPTDAKFFLMLKKELSSAWEVALEADDLVSAEVPQPVRVKNTFACKLAVRAISKVGLLSSTKANALVYQKVILDDMRDLNVRCADRVRVLPLAVAACLVRPDEVRRVESCVRQLYSANTGL